MADSTKDNQDRRQRLREILRTAPTIQATFADLDEEFQSTRLHFQSLEERRNALLGQLAEIASAKAEMESTGAAPPAAAAKTKSKGN